MSRVRRKKAPSDSTGDRAGRRQRVSDMWRASTMRYAKLMLASLLITCLLFIYLLAGKPAPHIAGYVRGAFELTRVVTAGSLLVVMLCMFLGRARRPA